MEMFAVISEDNSGNNEYSEDIVYGTLWYANCDKVVELIDEEIVHSYLYSIEETVIGLKRKIMILITSQGKEL